MDRKNLYDFLIKIQALSKVGIKYAKDPYTKANYEEISGLSKGFLENLLEISLDRPNYFERNIYPTPSISVRTVILNSTREKVLMVREAKDHTWSLPGGWCDIYDSPSEASKRECKEEAGIDIKVERLVGLLSFKPITTEVSLPEYVCVFEGSILKENLTHDFEIEGVGWFDIDDLPKLSPKVKKEEILRMILACKNKETIFD